MRPYQRVLRHKQACRTAQKLAQPFNASRKVKVSLPVGRRLSTEGRDGSLPGQIGKDVKMSKQLIVLDDEKIIYQWKNPSSRTDRIKHNEAKEYAVVEIKEASSGICIYAKFNDDWSPNPWSARALVRQILAQNKRLRETLELAKKRFVDPKYGCNWNDAADDIDRVLQSERM